MDRGLLSDAKLLEASRDFVCARLTTYADDAEGEFLKSVGSTRTGGVLNTSFVILAPDGVTALSGSGRSPRQPFPGENDEEALDNLLQGMKEVAAKYPGKAGVSSRRAVPYAIDFRHGLNVAACDNQPLVVVSITDEKKRAAAEAALAKLVWSPDYRGRFAFAQPEQSSDLEPITGAPDTNSIFVVEPGAYGIDGKMIAQTTASDEQSLKRLLDHGLKGFTRVASDNDTLKAGLRQGIEWESDSIGARESDSELSRSSQRKNRKRR